MFAATHATGLLILFCAAWAFFGCSRSEAPTGVDCAAAIAKIESGFGARGPYAVAVSELTNPRWPGQRISFHFPKRDDDARVPVVFFAHANGQNDPAVYAALIDHIVSRGYAVVFAPYAIAKDDHGQRYDAIWSGFEAAAQGLAGRLDLSRVGFVGHSYGAGALPWLARRALVDAGWGKNGSFVFSLAAWFALDVEPAALAAMPPGLRAVFVVFEEDTATDHRIAIAQYQAFGGRDTDKAYVLFRADANGPCRLPAPHTLPQSTGLRARDDALDERGLFRLFDALAATAFSADADARQLLFGDGREREIAMGTWPDGTPVAPLLVSRDPEPVHDESRYLFRISDRDGWVRYGEPAGRALNPDGGAPAP